MPKQATTVTLPPATEPAALSTTPPAPAPTPAPVPSTPAPAPAAEPPDITDAMRANQGIKDLLATPKKANKKKDEPPAPAPVEPPAAPVAATPTPAAPAAPATPEPAKVNVRKPKPAARPLTAEDIAAAVKQAIPQPTAPAATPIYELPEELKPQAAFYEQLEKINPKYRGIGQKQAEFMQKEIAYAQQWEQAEAARLQQGGTYDPNNPPEFNADDPKHAAFYDRYAPKIDPDDADEAKFELRFSKRYKEAVEPKLTEYEKTITDLRAKPDAEQAVSQFGSSLFATLNPDGKGPEALQKWSDANPIEAEVAMQVNQQVRPVVHAASLLWDGATKLDQNNEAHTQAAAAFNAFEFSLSNQSEPVEIEGKTWLPLAQFSKLPKHEQSRFCTTTKQALVNFISLNAAQTVKNIATQQKAQAEKLATKLGYVKPQPSTVTATPSTPEPAKPAAPISSPSVSQGAPISPSVGTAPAPVVANGSAMASMLGVR